MSTEEEFVKSLHLRFVQHFKFNGEKAQNVTFHDQNKTKKHFTLTH